VEAGSTNQSIAVLYQQVKNQDREKAMANCPFLRRKSKQSELLRLTGEKSVTELKIFTPSLKSQCWD